MANVINAPPKQHVDSVRDPDVMINLLQQADRTFPDGFVLNEQGNSAGLFEDGMHQIMGICNNDETLCGILHDGDPDLEHDVN